MELHFGPLQAAMIGLAILMLAACIWALLSANEYVRFAVSGEQPPRSLAMKTALALGMIAVVGVLMYLLAVSAA
jgi:hypothetical protein